MRHENTQVGKLIEQVKLAVLSNTPIVYIPTQQMEVIQEMLFSKECVNSIIPRMRIQQEEKKVQLVQLDYQTFYEKGMPIVDNYQVVQSFEPSNIENCPMLYIIYMKDGKEWDVSVTASLSKFVRQYLGIKYTKNYIEKEKIELTKKSLCIVVSPTFIPVPSQISSYTKTIYLESLSDEEIENIISSILIELEIDPQIVIGKEKLLTQMKVSFRGMSALRIRQLMQQMIKCQYIDFDGILESEITASIQDAKRELLNNCLGLRWEKVKSKEAAGLSNVVDWLNKHAPLFKDPEKAQRQHIDIPKGILITGIPGSGKSLMAMTAARLLNNMPLISLNMGMLRGGVVGESEHNLENALRTAESMAPCVLWIDEIEKAMSGSTGDGNGDSGVGQRMFGTFLTWLQEKSSACFVFATSNDITRLPPELFRSERFDRKFFTFMPMAEECAEIFASIIKSQNSDYEKELLSYDKQHRKEIPQYLFDKNLETTDVWLNILNECCTSEPNNCKLDDKEGRLVWVKRPNNKLLSGADISSIIKEAKFKTNTEQHSEEGKNCIYEKDSFLKVVMDVMKYFKTYGETNLINLAKSFYTLNKNQVDAASESCILDFKNFDEDELKYVPSLSDKDKKIWVDKIGDGDNNRYNQVLYNTLVGAINHYLPILEKKGQLS